MLIVFLSLWICCDSVGCMMLVVWVLVIMLLVWVMVMK